MILVKTVDSPTEVDHVDIPLTQEETRMMEGLILIEARARTLTGGVIGFKHVPKFMRKTVNEGIL